MLDSGFLGNQSLTQWGPTCSRRCPGLGVRRPRGWTGRPCTWRAASGAQLRAEMGCGASCHGGGGQGEEGVSVLACSGADPGRPSCLCTSLCLHDTQVTTCSVLCHLPASGRVTLVSDKTKPSGQGVYLGSPEGRGALALSPALHPCTAFLLLLLG